MSTISELPENEAFEVHAVEERLEDLSSGGAGVMAGWPPTLRASVTFGTSV